MVVLDITDRDAVFACLQSAADAGNPFTHIVNCAADRDPESCRRNPAGAYLLNAVAVEHLAAAANRFSLVLCQISTDYVFDGTNPPYREDDRPNPINLYGRTKLAGEFAAREAARHLILRVPALYRLDLSDERNCLATFAQQVRSAVCFEQDAQSIRYYTLADEVAAATRFLLEMQREGILHLSSGENTTKARLCRALCSIFRQNPDNIIDTPTPATGERRPVDSHLCTDSYNELKGPSFSNLSVCLPLIRE